MANHRSAQKRARQTIRRTARNVSLRTKVKGAVKAFTRALAEHTTSPDAAKLAAAFTAATREIRRAGSKGVLHANTVSRRVSRLALAHARTLVAS